MPTWLIILTVVLGVALIVGLVLLGVWQKKKQREHVANARAHAAREEQRKHKQELANDALIKWAEENEKKKSKK